MSALSATIRAVGLRRGVPRLGRAAPAIGCAVLDVAAAGILLHDASPPGAVTVLAAAALHLASVLLFVTRGAPESSLRWLCTAAILSAPCVGPAIAAVLLGIKGRGAAVPNRESGPPRRPVHAAAAVRRLAHRLPPCDALFHGDDEQRRATLSALARRADPEAMAVLRWAASGHDPDLALLAALALDEIGERAERRPPGPADAVEPRHAVR